jgi:multicomponent Na+:H+ antiporter subunit G
VSALVCAALSLGVASAWLGALALLRLSSLSRIHAVAFVNVAAGGAFTLATWLSDGVTSRTGKVLLIWLVLMVSGALSSHVTGRAIHLRGGERQ